MSTTTTTTEISSNLNSSCRLLECLNTLPFHDQCVFRSLLGHIDFLRLSACCRSLRSSIRNDKVLWQALYHSDFLSGAYYAKEMDFVLWCIRTDVNNPCTSDKRSVLLENVDWYNTYRRRVSTENNWRYGRCKTTRIYGDKGGRKINDYTSARYNNLKIIEQIHKYRASKKDNYYALELLPHSNLRSSNDTEHESTFSKLPNVVSLDNGTDTNYEFVPGDHYIAVYIKPIEHDTNVNIAIFTRKYDDIFTTFDVPAPYRAETIEGKWILLEHNPNRSVKCSLNCKLDIKVFDIDNSIMCPGSIDDSWETSCFYKATNNTAIVYMARVVVDDDDDGTDRIEWALYEFSSNSPVIQLRSGWFHLPEIEIESFDDAYHSSGSHMTLQLISEDRCFHCVLHDVTVGGQCSTPQNCYTISDNYPLTPLLQHGFGCHPSTFELVKLWTDISCSDDQILRFPGAESYHHIMGSLYLVTNYNSKEPRLLVDINTKEIICKSKTAISGEWLSVFTMVGMLCSACGKSTQVIQEYGEL